MKQRFVVTHWYIILQERVHKLDKSLTDQHASIVLLQKYKKKQIFVEKILT
jgi:hypothetical protein